MKKGFFLVCVVLSFWSSVPWTDGHQVCRGIAPANALWIPPSEITVSSLSTIQFDTVLDRIQKIYGPYFTSRRLNLVIDRRWESGTVNAYATRDGNEVALHMYGGFARYPKLSADAFALVACHEIGHHLGGPPKYSEHNVWASYEGAADYYSTLKCARLFFAYDDNEKILLNLNLDPAIVQICQNQHAILQDQQICIRSTLAGLNLAVALASMGQESQPELATPDRVRAQVSFSGYPVAQCRLDTYYAGALCRAPASDELSEGDYEQGSCIYRRNFEPGIRPPCWFRQ